MEKPVVILTLIIVTVATALLFIMRPEQTSRLTSRSNVTVSSGKTDSIEVERVGGNTTFDSPAPPSVESGFTTYLTCLEVGRIGKESLNMNLTAPSSRPFEGSSDSSLALAESRIAFYERHSLECNGVDVGNSYEVAIHAVEAGDLRAAGCLLSGTLPEPESEQDLEVMVAMFPRAARAAIELGVRRGDWNIVSATGSALLAQHGVRHNVGIGLTTDEKYTYLRLAYLGTKSPGLRKIYGEKLADLSDFISREQTAALDRAAADLYRGAFAGRAMPDRGESSCSPDWST